MTHEMGSTALWLMLLLGAFHGINPGMGWLFAVALGMQERKGSAVAKALVPIALGHALAVGGVVLAAVYLGMALPQNAIRYFVAAILFGLGIYSLVRTSPSALGSHAGRLQGPDSVVVSDGLGARRGFDGAAGAAWRQRRPGSRFDARAPPRFGVGQSAHGAACRGVHTAAYLAVTGLVAWVVYTKLGLAILRTAWLNLNQVWAGALVVTGLVTLMI